VRVRRLIAAALAVVALGIAPGAALAQSGGAGDDQYVDPFGGNSQQHQSSGGSKGSSGSSTGPALSSTPSLSASSTSTPAAAPAAASGQTLPRTGMDAALVAAMGLVLLAAGAAIRVRLRDDAL
jgi:LPXTG-motif cell wall-anchored protein